MAASIMRTVGEGFMRPNYEEQPINVQHSKLLDWLVDRKQCVADWAPRANTIQDKVAVAVAALLEDDEDLQAIVKESQPLNYFACERIHARVREKAGITSFLGQFTSEAARDWAQILRAYEKDGIYLAESAAEIQRAAMYQIPALKKQVSNYHQQLKDLTRKDNDYRASAAAAKLKFQSVCSQWGIEGNDIQAELRSSVHQLPALLSEAAELVRSDQFRSLIEYYGDYSIFVDASSERPAFPLLSFVIANGNAPLSRFLGTENDELAASGIESITIPEDWSVQQVTFDEVDAPIVSDAPLVPASDDALIEIDWDAAPAADDNSAPAINWDAAPTADDDGAAAINWDVDFDAGASVDDHAEPEIVVAHTGELAQSSLLDSADHRAMLLDELAELRAFLTQRQGELAKQRMDAITLTMQKNAPVSVQRESSSLVKSYDKLVSDVLAALTSDKVMRLLQLRSSASYAAMLAAKLELIQRTQTTMNARLVTSQERRVRLGEQIEEAKAAIEDQVTATRALMGKLEKALSKLYNNRPVYIVGDISTQ